MSGGDIKPWSQLDDEPEELASVRSLPADRPDGIVNDRAAAPGDPVTLPSVSRLSLKLSVHWAFLPLALAAIGSGWLSLQSPDSDRGAGLALGVLVSTLAAASILFLLLRARRASLTVLRDAIVHSTRSLPTGLGPPPVGAELQPIFEAMEQHAENIERRTAELLDEQKRIMLDLGLAEANRRQLEAIIGAIPEPILVVDPYEQVLLANPAAEALFQFAGDKSLRRPLSEVVNDTALLTIFRQTREADARAANRLIEHEIGSQVYAVRLAPLSFATRRDAAGNEHGVIALLRNITKEREASRNKSEFVAHAAHELRTPLSSIRAYVEMLLDGEAEDEKTLKEYYNIIDSSAERLGRMIDNILNISRIEAGTVRINKEPVAISVIVKEAIDVARPQADEKNITLTDELTPVVFRVNADRDLISQAVLNLLSNAIKYTPQQGKVHVRMIPQEENHMIRIEVTDTGVGIPRGDLPRMFEKFFRVEVNKKMAKGTGLGLNLVKHIVETIHEGKVTLTSEEGKGSTFGMNLPLLT
jgi:two-component system phosphate regulon sensor histidine kinase PhoR